jgi:uncharacterized membrane protein YcaP (DUF421 family)
VWSNENSGLLSCKDYFGKVWQPSAYRLSPETVICTVRNVQAEMKSAVVLLTNEFGFSQSFLLSMHSVFRAIFGYCFLVFMIRIAGRRPGKQMSPFEFVLVFFIGGLILSPTIGDDRSLSNAVCVILTVSIMHFIFAWLKQRSPRFGRIVDGTPLILLEKGQRCTETMSRMRVQDADVMTAARARGLKDLTQIKYAVLERNGEISVIKNRESS